MLTSGNFRKQRVEEGISDRNHLILESCFLTRLQHSSPVVDPGGGRLLFSLGTEVVAHVGDVYQRWARWMDRCWSDLLSFGVFVAHCPWQIRDLNERLNSWISRDWFPGSI